MSNGESYRLLVPDEDDDEVGLGLPTMTSPSLQRYNGHANSQLPRWPRTRPSRHSRTSLMQLFGSIRSPMTTRIALTLSLLIFVLCLAFCPPKYSALPLTSEPELQPDALATRPTQGTAVGNPIFKVSSTLFQSKNHKDDFSS